MDFPLDPVTTINLFFLFNASSQKTSKSLVILIFNFLAKSNTECFGFIPGLTNSKSINWRFLETLRFFILTFFFLNVFLISIASSQAIIFLEL